MQISFYFIVHMILWSTVAHARNRLNDKAMREMCMYDLSHYCFILEIDQVDSVYVEIFAMLIIRQFRQRMSLAKIFT